MKKVLILESTEPSGLEHKINVYLETGWELEQMFVNSAFKGTERPFSIERIYTALMSLPKGESN